ncbi:MAG: hypothetical protein IPK19_14840 [Chloroflexi bacterium]|nr:hypothetical protein [Chloroflexota bacterium]
MLGWRLNAPDGSVLFDVFLADRQETLTQTGTYTLTLRGNQVTSFGSYSFQILPVPTSESFTIAIGDTVSDGVPAAGAGNLELPGAQDIYSFNAIAGQEVIFDRLSGNAAQIGWRLNAPDGSVVFDAILVDRQVTLTQTGTYALTVRGNSPTGFGIYSFSLVSVSAVETFNISLGDIVSDGVPAAGAGNLEAPGAIDRYLFSASAGQWIYLDFLAGNNGLIGWRLEAPDGSTLFDSFLTDRLLQLDQTGVYTLILRGNTPDDFGTYSFALLAQDTFGLEFTIQPNAVVTAGELFAVLVQVIDPVTGDPRPLEDLDVTLILIDDATGTVVPGYSWSGITGINGAALIDVSISDPGIYRLRTDVAGYSAVDSDVFEVAGISGMGGAFLPQMDLNGEEGDEA